MKTSEKTRQMLEIPMKTPRRNFAPRCIVAVCAADCDLLRIQHPGAQISW